MAFNFGNLFSGLGNLFSGFQPQQPSYNYRPQPAPPPGASIQRSSSFLMNPNTSLSAQVTNPKNMNVSDIFRSWGQGWDYTQPLNYGATPNMNRTANYNPSTGYVIPHLATQPSFQANTFAGRPYFPPVMSNFMQGGGFGSMPSGFASVGQGIGQNLGQKIGLAGGREAKDFNQGYQGWKEAGKKAPGLMASAQQGANYFNQQAPGVVKGVNQASTETTKTMQKGGQVADKAGGMLSGGGDLLNQIKAMIGGAGGLGMLGQLFGGAGGNPLLTMLMGQMMGPKSPKMPDFGSLQSVQALQGFHPGTHQPLDPAVLDSIRHELDIKDAQEMRELQAVYHNARPGTDYTTDSAYQRDLANLQRAQGMRRADSAANAEFENMRIQLGASQQEMQKLSELAQLDVSGIMAQLGVSSQEAMQFKEQFGNIASLQMMKNLWPNLGGGQQQPTEQPQTAKVTS